MSLCAVLTEHKGIVEEVCRHLKIAKVPYLPNSNSTHLHFTSKSVPGIYPPAIRIFSELDADGTNIDLFPLSKKLKCDIELYDNQKVIVKNIMKLYNKSIEKGQPFPCLVTAPCGDGKTKIVNYMFYAHETPMCVITYNKVQASHWEKECKDSFVSLSGSRKLLRTLQEEDDFGDSWINAPDILIVVDMHLRNPEFVHFVCRHYSMLVIDEIDKRNLLKDNAISHFLIRHPFPITYFLTATPRTNNAIFYGHCVRGFRSEEFKSLNRFIVNYNTRNNLVKPVVIKGYKDEILNDTLRNQLIITCMLENLDQCIIVLCDRKKHMRLLFETIKIFIEDYGKLSKKNDYMYKISYGMKKSMLLLGDADESSIHDYIINIGQYKSFMILTTVHLCAYCLNLPSLTRGMFVGRCIEPRTVEQVAGRLERRPYVHDRVYYIFSNTSRPRHTTSIRKFLDKIEKIKATLIRLGWRCNEVPTQDLSEQSEATNSVYRPLPHIRQF